MTQTSETRAAVQSNNLCMIADNLVKAHKEYKSTGIPPKGEFPAVTAAQYISALGTSNLAILDAIVLANPQT